MKRIIQILIIQATLILCANGYSQDYSGKLDGSWVAKMEEGKIKMNFRGFRNEDCRDNWSFGRNFDAKDFQD